MARVLAAQGQAISALALHDRAIALRNELLNNPELWAEQRRLIRGLSIVLASSAESSVLLMKFDRATEHINRAIEIEANSWRNRLYTSKLDGCSPITSA